MTGNDTIAAVSTAPGEGGIGIVRFSGDRAAEILASVFVARTKTFSDLPESLSGKSLNDFGCSHNYGDEFADKTMYYGHIIDPSTGETVDEALVVYMAGPRSYTGEDVCEIQCHGGGVPLRRILDIVCGLGAVPAQPGEFTKRAFLNGRLDLAQAGAVIDLIKSKTERGYHSAKEQAEGRLSVRVREARGFLLEALAELAARIDYPEIFEDAGGNGPDFGAASIDYPEIFEEEAKRDNVEVSAGTPLRFAGARLKDNVEEVCENIRDSQCKSARTRRLLTMNSESTKSLNDTIIEAAEIVKELLDGAEAGRLIRDGIRVVIIGKPNVGKSSLFNALAREEAAIVTASPGTTRDSIGIWLDVGGVPVLLSDTAGIRKSEGEIETLGIERTKEQYRKAELSIFLLDGSSPLSEEDYEIASLLDPEIKLLLAINKSDLPAVFETSKAAEILPFDFEENEVVQISLIDDKNIKEAVFRIEEGLKNFVLGGVAAGTSLLVTKAGHKRLLEKALVNIMESQAAMTGGEAPEYVEVNLRAAWSSLGEITGETATDEIIDRVFEEFCVGK